MLSILTMERSMDSRETEEACRARRQSRSPGSRVVLGESWGVAAVCVIMGGCDSILLSTTTGNHTSDRFNSCSRRKPLNLPSWRCTHPSGCCTWARSRALGGALCRCSPSPDGRCASPCAAPQHSAIRSSDPTQEWTLITRHFNSTILETLDYPV